MSIGSVCDELGAEELGQIIDATVFGDVLRGHRPAVTLRQFKGAHLPLHVAGPKAAVSYEARYLSWPASSRSHIRILVEVPDKPIR